MTSAIKSCVGAILLGAFSLPTVAFAQQAPPPTQTLDSAVDKGRVHFQRGVQLYKDGDYRLALTEFRRANEIAPSYRILYNLGKTQLELQEYAGALQDFEKYLAAGGAEIDAERRAAVEADIAKVKTRVASVEITCNLAGANVFVDDVDVGHAPLAGLVLVSAGRRKISATKEGATPVTRVVDIVGSDRLSVKLEFAAPTAREANTRVEPKPAQTPSRPGLWIGLATTGLLTAGAVTAGILAAGANSSLGGKLDTVGVSKDELAAARSKTRNLALATDILGGAALVAGGVTVLIALKGHSDAPATAMVRIGPRGASIEGHF